MPSGATATNPSLRNMLGVPNHRHSGTAAILAETTGYASTMPPPRRLIDCSADRNANFATPRPRYARSTKKHVMRHRASGPFGGPTFL